MEALGLFFIIGFGVSISLVGLSWVRGKQNPYKEKLLPYECGFDALSVPSQSQAPFKVQFYIVGILFIIFDIEITLLIPWALSLDQLGWEGYFAMVMFLLIVSIGLAYEWKKGALTWS